MKKTRASASGRTQDGAADSPVADDAKEQNMKIAKSPKLTRKFLMALPDGGFLVSNCMRTPRKSVFAEPIQPGPQRQAQWKRIVEAGANGRVCHVFPTRDAVKTWFATIASLVGKSPVKKTNLKAVSLEPLSWN